MVCVCVCGVVGSIKSNNRDVAPRKTIFVAPCSSFPTKKKENRKKDDARLKSRPMENQIKKEKKRKASMSYPSRGWGPDPSTRGVGWER